MTDSFWTGGPRAYASGLRKRYQAVLADLQLRRDQCQTDTERESIDSQIEQHKAEFKSKPGDDGNLFF